MKAYLLLAPIAAVAIAGCTVVRPVAVETAPAVASPTVVIPPGSSTYVPAGSTVLVR